MIIRQGNLADVDRAVTLLRDSRVAAGFDNPGAASGFTFPFDPAYAARLFLAHLDRADRYCGILNDGGARGLLLATSFEHPFGPVKLAKETVWWIDPAHRGRVAIAMLDHYEAWWRSIGCAFGGMAGMGDDPDVGKLLRRRGYRVAETCFLKAS